MKERMSIKRDSLKNPDHHLCRNINGVWQLSFTIHFGNKSMGRKRVSLRTKDLIQARKKRDVIISALDKQGAVIWMDGGEEA